MDQDERLVRLESLFATHAPAVLAYARRRTDAATADDVLSDVFVVAWRRLEHVPPVALPWLLACARNVLADAHRSERRRGALIQRLMTTTPNVDVGVELADRALGEALTSLAARDREALMLVAWDGLSVEQAANVLGCSRRAFSMRLHRARKRLAAALARANPPEVQPTMEACND